MKTRRSRARKTLAMEYLENRIALSADPVLSMDLNHAVHPPGCACPACGGCGDQLALTLAEGHFIGDGHNHKAGDTRQDYVVFPEGWQGDFYGRGRDILDPVTVILDFNDVGQANTTDGLGNIVSTFDVTSFGFNGGDLEQVTNSILAKVQEHYHDVQWNGYPTGEQLTVEFELGDIGDQPKNGSSDYYYIQIGTDESNTGLFGQASLNSIRDPLGSPGAAAGSVIGSVFSDAIQGMGGLNPANALSTGDLSFTTNALAGTISHEIGHGLSLLHIDAAGTITPTGLPPIMGTGAIDLPNQDRLGNRDFSVQGPNSEAGGLVQKHLDQLEDAADLHNATMPFNLTTADMGFAYMFPGPGGDVVDDTTSGDLSIDFFGDVDAVFYAPQTSGVHTIELDTTTAVEPYLAVYDAETGAKLALSKPEGSGQDAEISLQLNRWQRYIIAAADFKSETTGDVSVAITGPGTTTPISLSFDANLQATTSDSLNEDGDVDAFRFVVPAGTIGSMDVVLSPSSNVDGVLVLWDSAGNQIQRSDSQPVGESEAISIAGASAGEEYIVTVFSDDYASSGGYSITVDFANSALPDTLTTASQGYAYAFPAATGDIVNNTTELNMFIGFGSDVDGVYFAPQTTSQHTIKVSNTNGSGVDPIVALYDDSGAQLAVDNDAGPDDDAELTYTLVQGQRYIIAAADVGADSAGSISLTIEATDTMAVGDLFVNSSGNGGASMFISEGDVDAFRFVAPSDAWGDLDVVVNPGLGLDAVAVLWDADGNELDRSDLFGTNVNETLSFSNVLPGSEYVVTVLANDYDGSDSANITVDFDISTPMELVVSEPADEDDGDYSTGDLSLREAVRLANDNPGPDTVTLPNNFFGTLGTPLGELTVTGPLTVRGPGASQLGITGLGTNRIWNIDDGNDAFDSPVVFEDLLMVDGVADAGAAIQSKEPLTLRNMEFIGNTATTSGGAIFATAGVVVEDSLFEMNQADFGGAIRGGALTITGSTFRNNSADYGGALRLAVGVTTVDASVFHDNTTNNHGGAIDNTAGNLTIRNSTISHNSANWGGGAIWSHSAPHSVDIEHSTLVFNESDTNESGFGSGGAILMDNGRTATISNSIVASNIDNTGTAPDIWHRASIRHSFIGNNQGAILTDVTGNQIGTDASPLDPMLGPLTDNGGPTVSHLPVFGSPVIDAGDPAAMAGMNGIPSVDQRGAGFDRVTDGDGDSVQRVDIGATETMTLPILPMMVDQLTDENDGDLSVGDLSLREAVEIANQLPGVQTIGFAPSAQGQVAMMSLGEIVISDAVKIVGPTGGTVTLDAQDTSRIFRIDDGDDGFGSPVTLERLTMRNGQATDGGGAIETLEPLTIRESAFLNNAGGNSGGAIYSQSQSGQLVVEYSTFDQNDADFGGAIRSQADAVIVGSAFNGNTANYGGAIRQSGGTATVSDSLFTGNTTNNHAGAIDVSAATFYLINSTVSGNSANWGGGAVWAHGAGHQFFASHSTITNNTADANSSGFDSGGGVFNDGGGTTTLDHTIVAGNTDNTGNAPDIRGSVIATFSLIGNSQGGSITDNGGNLIGSAGSPVDPQLQPLADNGGTTLTHALSFGSPAVDAGDSSAVGGVNNVPLYDQRGMSFDRVVDGDGDLVDRIDMGSYERQAPPTVLVVDTVADESDGDYSPGDMSLREAVGLANIDADDNVVQFAPSLVGQTILLTGGVITIAGPTMVQGLGSEQLTIDAQGNSGIFFVNDGLPSEAAVTLTGITLTGGSAVNGGAINSVENLTLIDTAIRGNSANSGGGVNSTGSLEVVDSTIENNVAVGLGGGIRLVDANAAISGSTVSGNEAGDNGGGITATRGTLSVTNSTVSGNSSGTEGGGMRLVLLDHWEITHTTITDNVAVSGGGLFLGSIQSTASMSHSIVAGNLNASGRSDIVGGNNQLGLQWSLVGDRSNAGFANLGGNILGDAANPVDPRLAPLAENGGSTKTHGLLATSPALNAGDPSLVAGNGTTPLYDQRGTGFDRIVDGAIDLGAFEGSVAPAGDFDGDLDFDVDDLDALVAVIAAATHDPNFDLTQDGSVDLADRDAWLSIAGATNLGAGRVYLLGDSNLDGNVDGQDFVAWNSAKFTSGALWSGGDFNADGLTDGQDFVIWNNSKFQSADHRLRRLTPVLAGFNAI